MLSYSTTRAAALLAMSLALAPHSHADDLDALSLDADEEAGISSTSASGRWYIEGSAGAAKRRFGLGSRSVGHLSFDVRQSAALADDLQAHVSVRVDAMRPEDARIDNPIISLREVYTGWQDNSAGIAIEAGRVNLREGPGYGFNPTDFLRDRTLRVYTTPDPVSLRQNRLGTVMLRAQKLLTDGAAELLLAPKLANSPSTSSASADLGATNGNNRALFVLGTRLSDWANARWLVFGEEGEDLAFGFNGTALLSQAAVAHVELSWNQEKNLLEKIAGAEGKKEGRRRIVAGLSYTTSGKLVLTGEAQYNQAALRRGELRRLLQTPSASLAYYSGARYLQDNAARQAFLLYAVQQDLFLKNLDLTAMVKFNRTDGSRFNWLELRYRMPRSEIAVQLQDYAGDAMTEFGTATTRAQAELLWVYYF